jgi:hypothetical protein
MILIQILAVLSANLAQVLADEVLILDLSSSSFTPPYFEAKPTLRIRLRPDLSGPVSTNFVKRLALETIKDASSGNVKHNFYRSESWGVLQGIIYTVVRRVYFYLSWFRKV